MFMNEIHSSVQNVVNWKPHFPNLHGKSYGQNLRLFAPEKLPILFSGDFKSQI